MTDWRVMVAETVTGTLLADITPRELPSFTRAVTDKGSWTVNVIPDDRANAGLDFHSYTDAGRFSWLVAHGDYVVQAGPVVTHTYDENTRALSVSGAGIQGLLARRVLRSPGTHASITHPAEDVTITGASLRGIATQLVRTNLAQSGYGLPIDVPDTEAGTNTRTYYAYDLAMVWDRLDELAQVSGGPELDFAPYLVAGQNRIRWELRIGGPLLGDQSSAAVWDYGGALSAIDVDNNGSAAPCTRVWVKGSGNERALLTGFAQDPSLVALGFPPTDYVDGDHTSVIEQATLHAHARADLAEFRTPTETWSCAVRIDGSASAGVEVSPALGNWSLGDAPIFGVSGHPWLPDGDYRRRVLGYSNADASTVTLTLQPTPAPL